MAWKKGRSSQRPPRNTTAVASAALTTAQPSEAVSASAPTACPRTGITTTSGTVVTSWKTDIARPRRP